MEEERTVTEEAAENPVEPGIGKCHEIVCMLKEKAALLQSVFDNTHEVFGQLKSILQEYAVAVNERLDVTVSKRVKMEYRDRGRFEAQIQLASDVLIFSMHSNVFLFERENIIWQNSYVRQNKDNAYCGIINIYNFLSDSFRYNRAWDEGYLIGRIFINRERQYMVEGKRQISYRHNHFGQGAITADALIEIVEHALTYTLDFDLLVPPYDTVKRVTVDQMNTKIENSKLQTGKRLGYQFRSDDV